MYSHERKAKIMELIKLQTTVSVNILAETLHSSKETIRRDLRELENSNMLRRTHGGAVMTDSHPNTSKFSNESPGFEQPFTARHIRNIKEKHIIAQKAATFIHDGDTIFIDNSSTTFFLLDYLPPNIHVTIITNSIKVLLEAAQLNNPNLTLISLAGFYNASNYSVYGSRTIKSADEFFPNKAFVSCTGVTLGNKMTDISLNEIDTKKAIFEKSEKVFLLVDHTKFAVSGPFFLSNFDAVHYIVTDRYDYTPEVAMQIQAITSTHNIEIITD